MADVADVTSFKALFAPCSNREADTNIVSHPKRMPLPHAPVDVCLRVIGFGTSKSVARRLSSMGVIENSIIKIAHQAGGNLVIAVENTRLAIEPSIAHKVMVVPVTD